MGQKVNPVGFRLGVTKKWISNWYAEKDYSSNLLQDIRIRKHINEGFKQTGISKIEIEKTESDMKVTIFSSKPGIIIGRKGEEADKLRQSLSKIAEQKINLNIKEVKKPEIDAQLIAFNIAQQLERRVAFRRVIKRALQNTARYNISGCKIMVSGRLNGAEMARTEWVRDGRVPLHTLKADIDYATYEAKTIYGIIGVKVWTYMMPQREMGRKRKNQ